MDAINAAQTTLDALVQKEAKEEEINKAQEILDKANKNMETLQKTKYKELFYYFPGLNGTAISQSMHPAGIVVSPITLPDNFGTFWNDGKQILYINMEEIHDGAGLVKYDLLGLKNVEIIRKTCEYASIPYPKSYTINWEDDKVWDDMITSPVGIFQFESASAAHMLKQFRPHKINDMSIVNAALRPSGASYRDRLLSGEINHNPSKLIDDLLVNNNGYLIFQEDVIAFLQRICGLTGSESDNIRRAIGRKQKDRLEKAMPQILEGYCSKSDKSRDIAEEEAKTFLQIIEDASSYMFGFNHSTGYSMIGYVCAYLRYYYPEEFIAAYLNCANNDDDIINGTALAKQKGIKINNIKFGESHADYSVDKKEHSLYKGIASIKYCNAKIAEELYELSKKHYNSFIDVLYDVSNTSVNSRQLEILTRLNYFSDYGGNKKLLDTIGTFSRMSARKQFKKADLEKLGVSDDLMKKYAGKETAKMYGDVDTVGLVKEMVESIPDKSFDIISQIKSEKEYLGYIVYANPNINEQYYIILDYDDKERGKPNTPRFTAYNIHDGVSVKTRIKYSKDYIRHPFGEYSILQIPSFTPSFKSKKVDGKWIKTDEVEDILTDYVVIK